MILLDLVAASLRSPLFQLLLRFQVFVDFESLVAIEAYRCGLFVDRCVVLFVDVKNELNLVVVVVVVVGNSMIMIVADFERELDSLLRFERRRLNQNHESR